MFLFLSYKPNKICAILILQCIKIFYTETEGGGGGWRGTH